MSKLNAAFFFIMNFAKFFFTKKIVSFNNEGVHFRGCKRKEISQVETVYEKISGKKFSKIQNILLCFFSQRFLFVVLSIDEQNKQNIIGMNLYYINYRDLVDKTIHEGYIGVLKGFEGRGIATQMRKQAIDHFKGSGFKGISSRISKQNLSSLRSAQNLGFKLIKTYFDKNMQEERHYLVKWFY